MKALFSYGTNAHAALLNIARPSFKGFADRHGYTYHEVWSHGRERPAPWYKVQAMRALLEQYDEVLFIGADCVIVDGREDMAVPADAWQALVEHHVGHVGDVPNTDVWLVRKAMLPVLEAVWAKTDRLHHGWWEQAALMDLMGYSVWPERARRLGETEVYRATHFLDNGWNVHLWDTPQPERKRIQHATMHPDREAVMREWAEQAEGWLNE